MRNVIVNTSPIQYLQDLRSWVTSLRGGYLTDSLIEKRLIPPKQSQPNRKSLRLLRRYAPRNDFLCSTA